MENLSAFVKTNSHTKAMALSKRVRESANVSSQREAGEILPISFDERITIRGLRVTLNVVRGFFELKLPFSACGESLKIKAESY